MDATSSVAALSASATATATAMSATSTAGSSDSAVLTFSAIFENLSTCSQDCFEALPGFDSTITDQVLLSLCENLPSNTQLLQTCVTANCTSSDSAKLDALLPTIQTGCNTLIANTANGTSTLSASVASLMSGSSVSQTAAVASVSAMATKTSAVTKATVSGAQTTSGARSISVLGFSSIALALFFL
ncbi:hypothetical protein HDU84_007556 [Entophlyctis sp. JEL0112]|nr:hypothetical protein HDU84_007556 [Entophlyctis sp. JEL0112]